MWKYDKGVLLGSSEFKMCGLFLVNFSQVWIWSLFCLFFKWRNPKWHGKIDVPITKTRHRFVFWQALKTKTICNYSNWHKGNWTSLTIILGILQSSSKMDAQTIKLFYVTKGILFVYSRHQKLHREKNNRVDTFLFSSTRELITLDQSNPNKTSTK